MELGLQGQTVSRVCFDFALTILTGQGYEMRVETEAFVRVPSEGTLSFDPDRPEFVAVHLARLVCETIIVAEAGASGELRIVFGSGVELRVAPNSEYEAWEVLGPMGKRIVCMPGGEIAHWGEQAR